MPTPSVDPLAGFRLDGRVAIVTGASSGLGARLAPVLAGAGAKVVLAARREERLKQRVVELEDGGFEALAVQCDVVSDADVERLIETAVASFGTVDVIVNAAGIAPSEDTAVDSPEQSRRVLAVNITDTHYRASDASSYVTAHILVVDGGWTAR